MEEQMWKQFYDKMQEKQNKPEEEKTEHEIRIQELDGGFFERFESLGQKEQQAAAEDDQEPPHEEVEEEAVHKEVKKDLLAEAVGLNIEELYLEVLYEVIHTVGCMKEDGEQEVLFQYLQKAFRMDPEKHEMLLEQARSKEPPNILLNVQIVEAKELRPKDANGLSDPFCTLYLCSDPRHRYNTSVKEQTLNPVWEEHFSLPVDSPGHDSLCIEVWDFDPAETVKEKMTKITDVKGVKGFRKLMKEIAVTASTGKHDNELIGNAVVHLKNIPATGQIMWVNLEKKSKVRRQGIVRVKIAFSSEKNTQVATQEHRHLLRIFALHEIESSQSEEVGEWNGEFSAAAESVLQQHVAQSGMTETDEALAQWVEYAAINMTHTVSCATFHSVLQKLLRSINNGLLTDEEIKSFWDGAKKILPSCFNTIKRLRKLPPAEKSTTTLLSNTLSILSTLNSMQMPRGLDLFPEAMYGWLTRSTNCDIRTAVEEAITQAAIDWYIHITEHNKPEDSSEKTHLKQKIKIIQLIRTDLQKAIEFHEKLFVTMLQVLYAKTLYTIYECKVSEMTEPLVNEICATLKPLRYKEKQTNTVVEDDPLALGTSLFELYLALQRFAVLGTAICPTEAENFHITKFHNWFHRGVAHWLDIAVYKAIHRIERAVELDELIPIDSTVKYSSSAVDTLHIYYQIKTFWQQLSWPDVEGSYTFVAKIMDDICRCSVHYADIMASKVDKMGDTQTVYEKKFEVTNEWCLAINNIDYVRQSIQPFVKELGLDDIIKRLGEFQSPSAAEHCRATLQLVMDNAVETVKNKILDLLETVAEKMSPSVRRFLMEGAELADQENNYVDRLMQYLDENLTTLSSQLNPDNFDRTLTITFDKLSRIMYELVENGLEKRRPHTFFSNLHKTLHVLMGFFRQGENSQNNNEMLSQIERLLTLHGMDTTNLIMQVHLARLEEQNKMASSASGLLTVRLQFVHDTLRIEIMNARNLKPMDSNGSCDPYVKIHFLPEELFADVKRPRTKTQKQNLFPLFDETFSVQLTREQRQAKDGMLLFMVKDQDYFGMSSQFLGEAYFQKVFLEVPEIIVLVPALLGLKGNLEMTLASRLSTEANLGNMDDAKEQWSMITANLILVQCQATVVGLLSSIVAVLMVAGVRFDFSAHHTLLLCACSTLTASIASFILGLVTAAVIVLSKKLHVNPDNIATPIAGSLGDITSLALLSVIADFFHRTSDEMPLLPVAVIVVYIAVMPFWFWISKNNKYTRSVLYTGWTPVVCAMLISTFGGMILDVMVNTHKGVAVFQPVINGVGGNLVSIQASRLSTTLHQNSELGILPDHFTIWSSPWQAFFSDTPHALTARVLMTLMVPGHITFAYLINYIKFDDQYLSMAFVFTYLIAASIQVAVLLYVAYGLTHLFWLRRINPDNSTIPYLTAIGDLLGIVLLGLTFEFLSLIGEQMTN